MKNVTHLIEDDTLVIRVDLKADYGRSKSGKTSVIASTQGFVHLGGELEGVMFSINVNRSVVNA
jgi:hypothetical protein